MSWRDDVSGCFGHADARFSGHFLDQKRAQELLKRVFDEGVGLEEFVQAMEDYLREQGLPAEHIEEQIRRVKDISSYMDD